MVALLLAAIAATTAVGLIFALPTNPARPVEGWVKLGSLEELRVGQPVSVREDGIYLVRLESGGVLALLRRSPHLGCTIVWRPDMVFAGQKGWFRDPCSGSNFTLTGERVTGPAPRGMDRYAVSVRGDQVFVDITTALCGPPVPPGGAC